MSRPVATGTVAVLVPVLAHGGEQHLSGSAVHLHGEPLFVHAARTAYELAPEATFVSVPPGGSSTARAQLVAAGLPAVAVIEGGACLGEALVAVLAHVQGRETLVVHDPRCPLLPAHHLHEVIAAAPADAVVVATRPMTDTVKSVQEGVVLETIDRELLRVLSSPLVVSLQQVRGLAAQNGLTDCLDVEDVLDHVRRSGVTVVWAPAPPSGRRVSDAAAASVLECLAEVRAAGS